MNRALALTPKSNSATSRSSTGCDVGSLRRTRYQVKGEGSGFAERLWSHGEHGPVSLVLPMAISASKQPA